MKFKIQPQGNDNLASGTHYHKGHPYRHGDVIESDQDLQLMHPSKFTRVDDNTPVTPPRKGTTMTRPTDEFEDPSLNVPPEPVEAEPVELDGSLRGKAKRR